MMIVAARAGLRIDPMITARSGCHGCHGCHGSRAADWPALPRPAEEDTVPTENLPASSLLSPQIGETMLPRACSLRHLLDLLRLFPSSQEPW